MPEIAVVPGLWPLVANALSPRIGAEIEGVRLSGDLPDSTIEGINAALMRHKVIFFRHQNDLTDDQQEQFSARLGELVPHPTNAVRSGTNAILELDSAAGSGRSDAWHTDVTFVDAYPKISVLRAVVIPATGGDTVWSNTAAAYNDFAPDLKLFAEKLWAVHTNAYDYAAAHSHATEEERRHHEDVFTSVVYETEHPVVRVHPETGERTLILGSFLQKFVGYPKRDSDRLYELLQAHVLRLENTIRWRWRTGDVAIWDNRATQHYALNDYGNQPRLMRRTTLNGDVPESVDGRRSVTTRNGAKKGTPSPS